MEKQDEETLPCTCCQGTGVHESYNPNSDKWIQQDCIPCKGTGKMTPSEIKEWYKRCHPY
jgi:DnaJ-class molecular chaperone